MLRRLPNFLMRPDLVTPVTRLFFAVDEASAAEIAGPDTGRASGVVELRYTTTPRAGQAWIAYGEIRSSYGRLEASLDGISGPWTTVSDGGSLPDPVGAGVLFVRFVSARWGTPVDVRAWFTLGLYSAGSAGLDDD